MLLTVLLVGSFLAGFIDALVGGGGLILLPLIVICYPQFTNAQALGINKVAAIFGTGSAAISLTRKVSISVKEAIYLAPCALIGASGGTLIAASVNKAVMRPIIAVALVLVGVFLLVKPSFGRKTPQRERSLKRIAATCMIVTGIGIYDGAFGPGTGVFLIMAFTSLRGGSFLENAAWAKVINTCTNLGALITFAIQGEILWGLGFALALTNILGAQLGARMVVQKGAGFIRLMILILVVVMSVKLGWDQYAALR